MAVTDDVPDDDAQQYPPLSPQPLSQPFPVSFLFIHSLLIINVPIPLSYC